MKQIVIFLLCVVWVPFLAVSQEKNAGAFATKREAIAHHKNKLHIARQYNRHEEQARILLNIAALLKEDDANKSLEHLKEALSIAKSIHHHQLAADISHAIIEIYKEQKNYEDALMTLEEHQGLLDSLFRKKKEQEIVRIRESYELQNSRMNIRNLQLENQRRTLERNIGLAIILMIVLILVILWLNFRKTNRLIRELENSNNVKDKLFSIIGHDLRGPVGSSVEMLKLLESGRFAPEQSIQLISELRKQNEASFDVLNSLLSWGKTQLEGVEVKPVVFHPKNRISRNIGLLSNQAGAKSITVQDNTGAESAAYMDPDHFDFIIRNLLSNAIKFSHPQGTIEINAVPDAKNNRLVFSVKDNGTGISEEKQKQFLKANMHVSFGTKGEKGTGIGLLLCKEFIRANNGKLWLESREGVGTTFYFSVAVS